MTDTPLSAARDALTRALAARPQLDGAALTEATKTLCLRRDGLRRVADETPAARRDLKALNGLISLVHAVHYPLGPTPWTLLEQAVRGVQSLDRT